MSDNATADSPFFQAWVAELVRSIETFSGEKPTVSCQPAGPTDLQGPLASDALLWWKQSFVLGDPNSSSPAFAWIGAPESTWSALGRGANAAEARSSFTEMIGQSLANAAAVLSKQLEKKIACGEGKQDAAPELGGCQTATVRVILKERDLPVMVAAIEPAIITFLPAARSTQSAEAGGKDLASYEYNLIPLLDRVIDLELPFSVVLGRATLPIKEVVKLTSGSLIELDQYVDQPMELRVRGAVVARCEVVTIGGNYGVRIKEIMSPEERMKLRSLPGNSKTPNR